MKNVKIFLLGFMGLSLFSCVDNNNKDNNSGAKTTESDYRQDAPTFSEDQNDMEKKLDTVDNDKRIPKDPVEIKSKGNAATK